MNATFILVLGTLTVFGVKYYYGLSKHLALLGPSYRGEQYTVLFYLWDKFRCFTQSQHMIAEGYARFAHTASPACFVVPTLLNGPTVVLPPSLAQEVCAAPDSKLNFRQAVIIDGLQADYLFPGVSDNPFHAAVLRRHLANSHVYSQAYSILEEARVALNSLWSESKTLNSDDRWVETKVYDSVMTALIQITMRVFVGRPHCRDMKFIHNVAEYFASVRLTAGLLNQIPESLRWLASKIVLVHLRSRRAAVAKTLLPIVLLRKMLIDATHAPDDKHIEHDILDWIITAARDQPEDEYNTEQIVDRVLMSTFVAVHTASITLYAAIFQLMYSPDVFSMLRAEAVQVIMRADMCESQAGLRLAQLRRTDSFITECMRHSHQNLLILRRTIPNIKGYQFSNGYSVPKNTVVALPGYEIHRDSRFYEDGAAFDPLRWMKDGETPVFGSQVNSEKPFLVFGHGKHICPGRFFAITELKCIIAALVLNYEIRLKEGSPMRPGGWVGENVMPDQSAIILVRRSQ